jgi:integrase
MLTDSQIKKLKNPPAEQKAPDKYSDGGGLQLHLFGNGGKYWRMAYRFNGKQKTFSVGTYPDVTLAEARVIRDDAKKLIKQGIDPSQAKKESKVVESGALTFESIANQWMEDREDALSESGHKKNRSQLNNDIFPVLGKMTIETIKAPHLLAMAQKIEARGAGEMARRALRLAGSVMRHAKRLGLIENDPTTGVSEALKPRKVQHMARIPESQLPKLLQDIDSYTGEALTVIGLKLIALTFVRTKELRYMEWTELDFDKKEWRISADKMKMGKVYIVPLSDQAIALFKELQQFTGHRQYGFYSTRSQKPISENTILGALWRMGYKGHMTGHGFRGLASTILHERNYKHAAIEIQLAHSDKDEVSASYNYADHLPYRRKMMQEWADYLDELRGGQVVPFPKVAG